MTVRPPGVLLSLWSILWFVAGAFGIVLLTRGSYLLGVLALALAILSAGLWLQWSFVRWPLIIYTLIIGLCGVVLLFIRPFELRTALQTFAFLQFSYLVYKWRPIRHAPPDGASAAGAR